MGLQSSCFPSDFLFPVHLGAWILAHGSGRMYIFLMILIVFLRDVQVGRTTCAWYRPTNHICLHQSFKSAANPIEVVDLPESHLSTVSDMYPPCSTIWFFVQDQGTDAGVVRNLAMLQTSETRLLQQIQNVTPVRQPQRGSAG